jgi:hypothetical protein
LADIDIESAKEVVEEIEKIGRRGILFLNATKETTKTYKKYL